jgi:hypothetical protein
MVEDAEEEVLKGGLVAAPSSTGLGSARMQGKQK